MVPFIPRCGRFPWIGGEAGGAAIELGLSAPFLVLSLVAAVEIGTGMYEGMQAQNAAEVGAVYASINGLDTEGIVAAVVNSTPGAGIAAIPAPSQFCGCPNATGITPMTCSLTCPDGGASGHYVRINARINHTPLLSLAGFGVPAAITGEAIVRMY